MRKLEELIAELCPGGVEYKTLNNIATIKRGERITKTELVETGKYWVISGGTQPFGKYNRFNRNSETITIASYGSAGFVNYVEYEFWANDVCLCVYPQNCVINKYLYYALKSLQHFIYANTTRAIPDHIPTEFLLKLLIPVPPLEIQSEIVRILDAFSELNAELKAELKARKEQYEYYRDELLSFNETHPLHKLIAEICSNEIEFKELGAVSTIERGVRVVKNQLSDDEQYPVFQNCLAPMGYYDNYNCEENTTYIISAGAAGEIGFSKTKFWAADDCLIIKNTSGILNKFIYYYLLTKQHFIQSKVRRASIPRLSRTVIEKIKIPIPPLEIQNEIVSILDNYDKLCTSLTSGLPAEIAAREKQYEYYRDLLLTFKPKVTA